MQMGCSQQAKCGRELTLKQIVQIVKLATQQGTSVWCSDTELPFVEAIIQVVGITGTGNDLHNCQA